MKSVLILGRQPELGLAELESLYGSEQIHKIGQSAAVVDIEPCTLAFDRLGGSLKFCKLLTTLSTINWSEIEKFLLKSSPEHSLSMPDGKMQLGLSAIGIPITVERLQATGLSLKKAIRKTGRSVRLIPNIELQLNSAQVIHNHLTGKTGWEIVIIRDNQQTIIAQTIKSQDITAYSQRDRERPKRDAKIGMLPPKLAQIIINLAIGKLPSSLLNSDCEERKINNSNELLATTSTILDPFCGTGVILQEASLMGYQTYGSDIDQRMLAYSDINLQWIKEKVKSHNNMLLPPILELGDATQHKWQNIFLFIATETYLGRPFTGPPTEEVLAQTISDCNLIISKFLRNIFNQIPSGTRLCLAIPAWQIKKDHFKHLSLLDSLERIGYNQVSFEHARNNRLIYYRSDQIVARELLVLTKR